MIRIAWKDIPGYEGLYRVSEMGDVESLHHHEIRLRKQTPNTFGYLQVGLCKDGKTHLVTVHSLVAKLFVKNPLNGTEINHKDGDKTNNKSSNLEWVTRSENMKHAYKKGLKKPPRSKKVRCIEDDIIFESCVQAAKIYNVHLQNIYNCIKYGHALHKKYHFEYI